MLATWWWKSTRNSTNKSADVQMSTVWVNVNCWNISCASQRLKCIFAIPLPIFSVNKYASSFQGTTGTDAFFTFNQKLCFCMRKEVIVADFCPNFETAIYVTSSGTFFFLPFLFVCLCKMRLLGIFLAVFTVVTANLLGGISLLFRVSALLKTTFVVAVLFQAFFRRFPLVRCESYVFGKCTYSCLEEIQADKTPKCAWDQSTKHRFRNNFVLKLFLGRRMGSSPQFQQNRYNYGQWHVILPCLVCLWHFWPWFNRDFPLIHGEVAGSSLAPKHTYCFVSRIAHSLYCFKNHCWRWVGYEQLNWLKKSTYICRFICNPYW